jgi:ubiquinone/menaquinone biosynthesis C-methylase UbiE
MLMSPNEKSVIDYYNTHESKHGYLLFLKGTKHFGYYNPGDKPWQFHKALRQMEERLAEEMALPANSKVLDAGCGMGDVASYLATKRRWRIEGVDILDFNIEEARSRIHRRRLEKRVHVQEMNYADLSFKRDTFDGIYTMETFVHAADPKRVLKEFYRALKPGGKIVMFEYSRDPDNKMSTRAAKKYREINELAAMPSFQQFNHGVQEALMREAGFENVRAQDITLNMLPMVKTFAYIAHVPYKLLSLVGIQRRFVNMMSAVELWRYRRHFRYNIYTANKPR